MGFKVPALAAETGFGNRGDPLCKQREAAPPPVERRVYQLIQSRRLVFSNWNDHTCVDEVEKVRLNDHNEIEFHVID